MENYNNVEITESGLQCDNPECDWTDQSISFKNYKDWIDKPCPKCGQNVLTLEDYTNAETVRLAAELVNSMTPEELAEMVKEIDTEVLSSSPIFSGTEGIDLLADKNAVVNMKVNTYKEIKVISLQKA